jgi:hypothetical protein
MTKQMAAPARPDIKKLPSIHPTNPPGSGEFRLHSTNVTKNKACFPPFNEPYNAQRYIISVLLGNFGSIQCDYSEERLSK